MYHWKLGVSTAETSAKQNPILLNGTIPENLQKAADLGYQAIEVHMREDEDPDIEEIRSAMKATGTAISQIITGKLNTEGGCSLTDDRPYVTEACLKGLYRYVDLASALGSGIVLGWAKGTVPPGKAPGRYMKRLAANLKLLNAYSRDKMVPVNIEVINRYETNIFVTVRSLLDFLDEYELDNCFVHLDTFHMAIEEGDIAGAIRSAAGRIGYVHVADNHRWYPGSGELDFKKILSTLDETGYRGYITVECLPYDDGYETARKAHDYLKGLMDQA